MLLPTIFLAALGLGIGAMLNFSLAYFSTKRWIYVNCGGHGPDHIATNVRGKAVEALGWLTLILAILIMADAYYFKRTGTLHNMLIRPLFNVRATGAPMWSLWGGWMIGLVVGSWFGAYSALRRFTKCRHIGWRHLIAGH